MSFWVQKNIFSLMVATTLALGQEVSDISRNRNFKESFSGNRLWGRLPTSQLLSPSLSLLYEQSRCINELAKRPFIPNLYSSGTHQLALLLLQICLLTWEGERSWEMWSLPHSLFPEKNSFSIIFCRQAGSGISRTSGNESLCRDGTKKDGSFNGSYMAITRLGTDFTCF